MENKVLQLFRDSTLAGMAISIGCIVYLSVGGVAGAVLFAFGLITVILYRMKLYTGTAGFFRNKNEALDVCLILLGNIVGCFLTALCAKYSLPELSLKTQAILEKRLALNTLQLLLLSAGCGFIMTTAVKFAKDSSREAFERFLPLLFGIPVFICCGFIHSIADAFYYCVCPWSFLSDNLVQVLLTYLTVVAGNLLGCNLYRLVQWKLDV